MNAQYALDLALTTAQLSVTSVALKIVIKCAPKLVTLVQDLV